MANQNFKTVKLGNLFLRCYRSGTIEKFNKISQQWGVVNFPVNKKGDQQISFRKGKVKGQKSVHFLVAEIFIPNPQNCRFVDRIDGNKMNNSVENLVWVTDQNKGVTKIAKRTLTSGMTKFSDEDILKMRELYFFEDYEIPDLVKMFNSTHGTVANIIAGRSFAHLIEKQSETLVEKFHLKAKYRNPIPVSMESEEWVNIDGYPRYQVSNFGRIRGNQNKKNRQPPKWFYTTGCCNPATKYPCVTLSHERKAKTALVHRLVAKAFVHNENPNKYTDVNHIDFDRTNNRADNLAWVSKRENLIHQLLFGKSPGRTKGETSHLSSVTEDTALQIIELIKSGYGNFEIADKLNVTIHTIKQIRTNRTWKHLGFDEYIQSPKAKGRPGTVPEIIDGLYPQSP